MTGFTVAGSPLGSGGFATTWAALRGADGRPAALKVSRVPSLAAAARLAREAEALARVGPPVVPELFAHGRTGDGRAFLAMERIDDSLLSEVMAVPELMDLWRVGRLAGMLCRAVAAIHRAGEVHRDVKPENLFVGADELRIIDFGGGAATPEYAAPEQMRGGEGGAPADVYAVGAIVYELLTGRPPFVGDLAAIEYGVASLRPAAPSALAAVPRELDEIVLACLEKDPAARPDDVEEVGRRIEVLCRAEKETGHREQDTGHGEGADPGGRGCGGEGRDGGGDEAERDRGGAAR